jgi:hypothetical protein
LDADGRTGHQAAIGRRSGLEMTLSVRPLPSDEDLTLRKVSDLKWTRVHVVNWNDESSHILTIWSNRIASGLN